MVTRWFMFTLTDCIFSDITERTPNVRNVTTPVSFVRDPGLSPAGSVLLLFWSCKAPSCVLSDAHTASIRSQTSANSATLVVRPAQVQTNYFELHILPEHQSVSSVCAALITLIL